MSRLLQALLVIAPMVFSGTAQAEGYSRLTDRDAFVSLVAGRDLVLPFFGSASSLNPSDMIGGAAQGAPISGEWGWKDGYFCRTMRGGSMEIPANCQTVEVKDGARLRFTTDQGQGRSATFVLN